VLKIKTTGNGYFETLLIFDKESIRGTYHISTSYTEHVDKNMDITFQVIDSQSKPSTVKPNSLPTNSMIPQTEKIVEIPKWMKNNAGWWANEKIGDHAFLSGIQYLIKEKILDVSGIPEKSKTISSVPIWVKNIAGFWAEDKISDDEFVKGIQYLVQNGLITVS